VGADADAAGRSSRSQTLPAAARPLGAECRGPAYRSRDTKSPDERFADQVRFTAR